MTTNGTPYEAEKVECADCKWHGLTSALLTAINPFEPKDTITGCPQCKGVDTCLVACDEPDCWELVSCGTPTDSGYRRTCGKHRPVKP